LCLPDERPTLVMVFDHESACASAWAPKADSSRPQIRQNDDADLGQSLIRDNV
jgi:hypothetical protein